MWGTVIARWDPESVETQSLQDGMSALPLAGIAPHAPGQTMRLRGRGCRVTEQNAGWFGLNSVGHPNAAYFIMEKMIAGTSGSPAG